VEGGVPRGFPLGFKITQIRVDPNHK
jgi:hypothetical protein